MTTGTGTQAEGSDDTEQPDQQDPVIQLSRPVAAPLGHVWEVLVSDAGAQALLGEGARLGAKGEPYRTANGANGVLRSYHPLEQLRVSWHETSGSPATVVEVDLRAEGDGTVLDLRQEHLPSGSDTASLATRWRAALDAVAGQAEG